MSNISQSTENNFERRGNEEEKEDLRFDTIESIKRENESILIPDYNIKKDRMESMNISLFDDLKNNKNDIAYYIKNNNNNPQSLDENINQSLMSFQDLPLHNKSSNFNSNSSNDGVNIDNHISSNKNKFNNNNINKYSDPYLEVEDAGEKKDIYGSYRVYKIIEIYQDPNENKIKCERRYNDFYLFFSKLQNLFPYLLIPSLEKNFLSKIITIDDNFYIKRSKQLNFFLNYINEHGELKCTKEFVKFVSDPIFDNKFFLENESFCDITKFTESMRNHDTIANKIVDFFKIPFTNIDHSDNEYNENERNFIKKLQFFNLALKKLNDLQLYVSNLMKDFNLVGNKFKELSDDIIYLKDVNFSDKMIKQDLISNSHLSMLLGDNCEKNLREEGRKLEDELEITIFILNGLCDALERYKKFCKFQREILKYNKENRESNSPISSLNSLKKEEELLKEKRRIFENKLNEEIKRFGILYNDKLVDILKKYSDFIKTYTITETEILKPLDMK